jgi:hypothetical protein
MCGGIYRSEQNGMSLRSTLETKFESPKFKDQFRDCRCRITVTCIIFFLSRRKKIVFFPQEHTFFSFNLAVLQVLFLVIFICNAVFYRHNV